MTTPLHYAVIGRDYNEVVRLLNTPAGKVWIDEEDGMGMTPLCYALFEHHDGIEALLRRFDAKLPHWYIVTKECMSLKAATLQSN